MKREVMPSTTVRISREARENLQSYPGRPSRTPGRGDGTLPPGAVPERCQRGLYSPTSEQRGLGRRGRREACLGRHARRWSGGISLGQAIPCGDLVGGALPVRGHQSAGQRPALVISVDAFNHGPAGLVLIIPLTTDIADVYTLVIQFNGPGPVALANISAGRQVMEKVLYQDPTLPTVRQILKNEGAITS